MRALVTGLSGFTGQYIKQELELHGYDVVGLESDLIDLDALCREVEHIQPEIVLHLAGISFVGHGDPNALYSVNLIGTRNLLVSLEKSSANIQSILLASSASVYRASGGKPLDEKAEIRPNSDYSVSKFAMENMARLWFDRLPLFIVRPFNYTGVGQDDKFLIPKIVSHFKNGKKIIELGNVDIFREFGDVRSVAVVYRELLACSHKERVFNVCTGRPYSLREVMKVCEDITGRDMEIRINQDFVRRSDPRVLTGDNGLLKNAVGDLYKYNLKDTLEWMLE